MAGLSVQRRGAQGGWGETSHLHSVAASTTLLYACSATSYTPTGSWTVGIREDHAERRPDALWLRQVEANLRDTDILAWRLPGRWSDRGTIPRWTRRRAAPAYAPIPDLKVSSGQIWGQLAAIESSGLTHRARNC